MSDRLDLSLIEKDLSRGPDGPVGPMRWLQASHDDPTSFWRALLVANGALFPWPGKSSLYRKYDFFHDIIARNQQNPSPAFRWFQERTGWRELGYRQLGRLAAERATHWAGQGAHAGQKLCLISYLNDQFLVSFLAALKIGLVVSLLPPSGRSFLRRRLEAVTPDFIWAEEEYVPLISEYHEMLLSDRASGRSTEDESRSHSYAAGKTFALAFDPTTPTPHVPRELGSDTAYLCAMRDGMVALGLKPGEGLAAPGLGIMETQPALLLACLLNGATFVHLDESTLAHKPKLLAEGRLRAVGVTDAVREMLLDGPVEVGKAWDFWFRDPAESQDIEEWREFVKVLQLSDAFAGNLRWNASLGGCILFSIRRKGSPHPNMLPAAGVPWKLVDPADDKRESLWGHGLFAVRPPEMEVEDGVVAGGMLAPRKHEWMFVRPVLSRRSGRCYPVQEVLEALLSLPFGAFCSMVEVPASGAGNSSIFVLLVFVGGRKVNEAQLAEAIRKKVLRELGREFLPDRIQVLELHPRRGQDGEIDHEWCGKEFLSGALSRRSRGEVTRCLTELRDLIHFSRTE